MQNSLNLLQQYSSEQQSFILKISCIFLNEKLQELQKMQNYRKESSTSFVPLNALMQQFSRLFYAKDASIVIMLIFAVPCTKLQISCMGSVQIPILWIYQFIICCIDSVFKRLAAISETV